MWHVCLVAIFMLCISHELCIDLVFGECWMRDHTWLGFYVCVCVRSYLSICLFIYLLFSLLVSSP